MSQEHIIYYTLTTFWPRHNCLKSDMLAPLGDATTCSQNNRKIALHKWHQNRPPCEKGIQKGSQMGLPFFPESDQNALTSEYGSQAVPKCPPRTPIWSPRSPKEPKNDPTMTLSCSLWVSRLDQNWAAVLKQTKGLAKLTPFLLQANSHLSRSQPTLLAVRLSGVCLVALWCVCCFVLSAPW